MEEMYQDETDAGGVPSESMPEAEAPAEESAVAVIPKSFFPGDKPLEPGNECTIRVEEVQDDQVLVSYSHSPQSTEPAAPPSAPMDEEMQTYMQ